MNANDKHIDSHVKALTSIVVLLTNLILKLADIRYDRSVDFTSGSLENYALSISSTSMETFTHDGNNCTTVILPTKFIIDYTTVRSHAGMEYIKQDS